MKMVLRSAYVEIEEFEEFKLAWWRRWWRPRVQRTVVRVRPTEGPVTPANPQWVGTITNTRSPK